jgi:hypothetical protein
MSIPDEYASWFRSLGFDEINFGYAGLKLTSPDEIDNAQIGYSRSPEGMSLCGAEDSGAWKASWTVIGTEVLAGDPIFLDDSGPSLRVMTAMHGEEFWEPRIIASSLPSFAVALKTVRQLSAGRENPVELEQNPLSSDEREEAMQTIATANSEEIDLEFWSSILES